jgi:hypothetical protein
MKYILTLEAHYKKRGLIGKAVDLIKGRKDFNDLIEDEKNLGAWCKVYSYDKISSKIEEVDMEPNFGTSVVINWKEKNPDKFLIFNLSNYKNATHNMFQLIKFDLLIKDLLEVSDRRLEILSIIIRSDYENADDLNVGVIFREDGFEIGDGMPDDVYDNYVSMVSSGLKEKREKYLKEYNILQSQKTTQKMKYRSIRLYYVTTGSGYQSKFDDDRGLITLIIDPRM